MHIKPISQLTKDEIAALAQNAADNFVPPHEANVFDRGTSQHRAFIAAYQARQQELSAAEA